MRIVFLAILLAVLWPTMVAGQNWAGEANGTGTNCEDKPMNPRSLNVCYYYLANADTTNSGLLDIRACASATLTVNSNTAGTGTGGAAILYGCDTTTADTSTCNPIYSDAGAVTLNGDASTGRAAIYGIEAKEVYLLVSANATGAFRAKMICHGPTP